MSALSCRLRPRILAWSYERHLKALAAEADADARADHLDLMAITAGRLAAAEPRPGRAGAWRVACRILRRLAASERCEILTEAWSLGGHAGVPILTAAYAEQWEALALAALRDARHERAAILAGLCEAAVGVPGVLVLDDIAASELAIAGPLPEPEAAFQPNADQVRRDALGLRGICAADGMPGTEEDPLGLTADGWRVHRSDTTAPASAAYGIRFQEAPAAPADVRALAAACITEAAKGGQPGEPEDGEVRCSACGGLIGMFIGHAGWQHYRGDPPEIYDAGHEATIAAGGAS